MDKEKVTAALPRRRTFLKSTAVATLSAGIAGCLGGTSGGGSEDVGDAELREELNIPELDFLGDIENELNMLQWSGYMPDGFLDDFKQAFGVKTVNVTNIGSNDEMFNKLKAGGTEQFDFIVPTDWMLRKMVEQDMVEALDLAKIPNYTNLQESFQNPQYDPGNDAHAAPWLWGTNGIGWSEEVLGADATVDSWDAMWNEEWEGDITMLNNMRACIGASLQRLGYSLNSTKESEVQEAKEELIDQKPVLKTYVSTVFDILANGTASPCYGWSGDVLRGQFESTEDGESPVHYEIPKEGSSIWTDNGAIPKDAKNLNAGYAFLVYFLTPKVNASLANFARYGSPNDAAQEHIEPRIREATSFPEDVMSRLEYYESLGEGIKLWQQAWDEVQGA